MFFTFKIYFASEHKYALFNRETLYKDWLDVQTRQLSPEQQAARQHFLETMARAYPLGIAAMKREAFYD